MTKRTTEDITTTTTPAESRFTQAKIFKSLRKRLPITSWLPRYSKQDAIGDLIAGITVGLTLVPQSLGYAAIAGLSPEYGLYSSYFGALIYVFLGTCRQASLGPTAIMGLMTYQTCGDDYPSCVVLASFYSGVFELLMAVLQLGWVVSFISEPVTVGFTSGAALTILSSQVKSLLGFSGDKGNEFITYWKALFVNFRTIRVADATLGIGCIVILMLMRKLKDVKVENKSLATTLWLLSLSRNALVILLTSALAFIWDTPPFKLVGNVQGGFPSVKVPEFQLGYRPHLENGTWEDPSAEEHFTFMGTWSELKTGPLVIALISVLQVVSIGKAFGAGQAIDATQEMFALGIVNVVGSFFSAIPNSAAFSRSAVNDASGVRTPLGGLYTGVLVLLSLNFLTGSFYWIPKSSLAAVIIAAVFFMIDYESIVPMWKISKIDAICNLITFLSSLAIGMEYGILIGVGVSVGALLLKNLRPEIKSELRSEPDTGVDYVLITPSNGLSFPSVDHISTSIRKISLKQREIPLLILDFQKWTASDYTGASAIVSLEKGMRKNGKTLGFLHCGDEWVANLKIAGLAQPPIIHGEEDIPRFIQEIILKGRGSGSGGEDKLGLGLPLVVIADGRQAQTDNVSVGDSSTASAKSSPTSSRKLQP